MATTQDTSVWVVDWQNKNPSVIIELTATGKARKERKLTGDEAKFAWVDDELREGDELYTELGASADIVALMALKKGVRVLRILNRDAVIMADNRTWAG